MGKQEVVDWGVTGQVGGLIGVPEEERTGVKCGPRWGRLIKGNGKEAPGNSVVLLMDFFFCSHFLCHFWDTFKLDKCNSASFSLLFYVLAACWERSFMAL